MNKRKVLSLSACIFTSSRSLRDLCWPLLSFASCFLSFWSRADGCLSAVLLLGDPADADELDEPVGEAVCSYGKGQLFRIHTGKTGKWCY